MHEIHIIKLRKSNIGCQVSTACLMVSGGPLVKKSMNLSWSGNFCLDRRFWLLIGCEIHNQHRRIQTLIDIL